MKEEKKWSYANCDFIRIFGGHDFELPFEGTDIGEICIEYPPNTTRVAAKFSNKLKAQLVGITIWNVMLWVIPPWWTWRLDILAESLHLCGRCWLAYYWQGMEIPVFSTLGMSCVLEWCIALIFPFGWRNQWHLQMDAIVGVMVVALVEAIILVFVNP